MNDSNEDQLKTLIKRFNESATKSNLKAGSLSDKAIEGKTIKGKQNTANYAELKQMKFERSI